MARPTKRNTERETTLLNALREGQTRSCACGLAGIDADTFPRWCKASPDFASAVAKAESEAEQSRVLTIQQASIGGSWQASAWWLARRRSSEWGTTQRVRLRDLTPEQLRGLLEEENTAPLPPALQVVIANGTKKKALSFDFDGLTDEEFDTVRAAECILQRSIRQGNP